MNLTTSTASLSSAATVRQAVENRLAQAAPSTSPAALSRLAARVALEQTLADGIKHATGAEVEVCFSGEEMVTIFGKKAPVETAVAWLVASGWEHTDTAADPDVEGEIFAYLDTSRAH